MAREFAHQSSQDWVITDSALPTAIGNAELAIRFFDTQFQPLYCYLKKKQSNVINFLVR